VAFSLWPFRLHPDESKDARPIAQIADKSAPYICPDLQLECAFFDIGGLFGEREWPDVECYTPLRRGGTVEMKRPGKDIAES
jgi:hypothetical protein